MSEDEARAEHMANEKAERLVNELAELLHDSGLHRWGGDLPGDFYASMLIDRLCELTNFQPRNPGPSVSVSRTRRDRMLLIERDGGKCNRCGVLGRHLPEGEVLHVDHIVPVARGGGEELENKQLLCPACNTAKGVSADGAS